MTDSPQPLDAKQGGAAQASVDPPETRPPTDLPPPEVALPPGYREFIPVASSRILSMVDTPLYRQTGESHALYKPTGVNIGQIRLEESRHPRLFFRHSDRDTAVREIRSDFLDKLSDAISSGDIAAVKKQITELMKETLAEKEILGVLPETVNQLVSEYAGQPDLLRTLAHLSSKDYGTAVHSVNVMALTVSFCLRSGFPRQKVNLFGLGGLLHDVGKIEMPAELLGTDRHLTPGEVLQLQQHARIGGEIIRSDGLLSHPLLLSAAVEHHERLDGSGYPRGIRRVSRIAQLIGIIDSYEKLTSGGGFRRSPSTPFEALKEIKSHVDKGRYNGELFKAFCYSLKTH